MFNPTEISAIWMSLKVALISTLLLLPFGLGLGYILARRNFMGKTVLESLILMPLVMPPVATGYLLLLLLGKNGWIGKHLDYYFHINLAFSFSAVVIASMVVSFPLLVRAIRASIEMVDIKMEEASRTLGLGFWKTFIKVVLPLSFPGIIAGVILSFTRSLGEFGATITFAGNIQGKTQTIPLAIYENFQIPGNESVTLKLVLISVGISFLAILFSEWHLKKMKNARG